MLALAYGEYRLSRDIDFLCPYGESFSYLRRETYGDRWADAAIDSRDLIDLAMLKQRTAFPQRALEKAEAAYPTLEPLKRSIQNFQAKPDYRLRCYQRLQVDSPCYVVNGLDQLAEALGLPMFERQFIETE